MKLRTLLFLVGALTASSGYATGHIGDFAPGDTIDCNFGTVRPSSGASYTLAGTPAISVYKDNSATESTAGVTLSADFDSRTGLNHVRITTASDGTFYAAGSYFEAVITAGTVDSVSVVGQPVCSFTLAKTAALRPATAGRQLVVDSAGLADANTVKIGPTGSGTAQTARDIGASVLLSSGTGTGQVSLSSGVVAANALQISGDATAADNLETAFDDTAGAVPWQGIVDQGTAQAGSSTTLQLRSAANFTADNRIVGATCNITAGTGAGQSLTVASYVNSTDTATMSGTWPTTPDNTSFYRCYGTAPSTGGSGLDAAGVRAAVGLASANLDTQLGTIDDFVDTEVAAIKTKTDFLPSATAGASGGLFIAGSNAGTTVNFTGNVSGSVGSVTGNVGGNVTGSVGSVATGGITAASIATDAIGAAELAADAATEIGTATWATTTRLLTAGTNIALAKGTGVTGFNDLDAAGVRSAVGLAGANLDTQLATIDTVADGVKVTTDKLDTALELDGGVYRYTANALEQSPAGGGGGGTDWTVDERTAIKAVLGIGSGPGAGDPTAGILDTIRDNQALQATNSALSSVASAIAALNDLGSDDIRNIIIEDQGGGISLGCAIAALLSYAAGDLTTSANSPTFRDASGTETRITGTISSTGNRNMTITCPSY